MDKLAAKLLLALSLVASVAPWAAREIRTPRSSRVWANPASTIRESTWTDRRHSDLRQPPRRPATRTAS